MIMERIRDFIGSKGSLRRRTIDGGNWMLGKSLLNAGVEMVRAAVFARVLFPADYGLMALAATVVGLLEAFSATGIEVMIMRDDDDVRSRLPAYWSIMFVRGLVLAALCVACAVPVAHFYGKPGLVPLVSLLSITFVLRGASGFGREIAQRGLAFRRVATVDTVSVVVELAASLVALMLLRNVWALAAYSLIHAAAQVVGSYVLMPWRPHLKWDAAILRKTAVFSGSIIVLNILNYFFASFDVGTIGKLFTLDQVGLYARANFLALLPVTYLANMVAPVVLPVFRVTDSDPQRLRRAFINTLLASAVAYAACGGLLYVFSRPLLLVIYGERWIDALHPMRILLIYGVSKAAVSVVPMVMFVKNRPWMVTVSAGAMALVMGVLCVPLTRKWGVEGTAWAVVIAGVTSHAISVVFALMAVRRRQPEPEAP